MFHPVQSPPSADDVLAQAGAIAAREAAFAPMAGAVEALAAMRRHAPMRVGVLGLSGSGKSTLLNALMGEALLPEETCATSQMLVSCRWGETRRMLVRFLDDAIEVLEGDDLTPQRVAGYCAARLNPKNAQGVKSLEWSSPASLIPAGIALTEASGLDGMADDEEAAIRRFLPGCDAVIFVASIRQPLKPAETRLIAEMAEYDQPSLFVLTQADLERDTYQGGKLWRSRQDKLARHRARLERQLAAETALKAPGTAVVAAKQALGDRDGEAWREAGLEALVAAIAELDMPEEDRQEARDQRMLQALDRQLAAMREALPAIDGDTEALDRDLSRLQQQVSRMRRGLSLELTPRREQAAQALLPLVAVFRELGFQRAFVDTLRRLGNAPPERVLLLGAQRENHVRLAALLGHDLALMDELEVVPDDTWILVGDMEGFQPTGPAIRLPAPETLLAKQAIAIAPADHHLAPCDWEALFSAFPAIGLELDLARPAIGRADAERAPYHRALMAARDRLFYTCGNGALFADRLDELAGAGRALSPFGHAPWFAYEDYDARYTHFLRLTQPGVASGRDLVRRWRAEGLPLDEPFTEAHLLHTATTLTHTTRGIS